MSDRVIKAFRRGTNGNLEPIPYDDPALKNFPVGSAIRIGGAGGEPSHKYADGVEELLDSVFKCKLRLGFVAACIDDADDKNAPNEKLFHLLQQMLEVVLRSESELGRLPGHTIEELGDKWLRQVYELISNLIPFRWRLMIQRNESRTAIHYIRQGKDSFLQDVASFEERFPEIIARLKETRGPANLVDFKAGQGNSQGADEGSIKSVVAELKEALVAKSGNKSGTRKAKKRGPHKKRDHKADLKLVKDWNSSSTRRSDFCRPRGITIKELEAAQRAVNRKK